MNILCKMGFHKRYEGQYIQVRRRNGRHKWHRNYFYCTRCGKLFAPFSKHKTREG